MLPARELYGDMLLAAGRPAEALAEYEKSQLREPNRYRRLFGAGQAAAQAGNRDKAMAILACLVGTMLLARSVDDAEFSRALRKAARGFLR